MNGIRSTSKASVIPLVSLVPLLMSGCQRVPAFNVEGSFFPGWIVCVVFGILSGVCIRWVLSRIGLELEVKPPILIYPCIALSVSLTMWLIFFR
jgi:fructose-specific phosphotransferase system IIC component